VIGFTTGRQTSQRLNSLLRELACAIPDARIIRRGKSSLDDLGKRFLNESLDYAVVLQRWQGGPGRMDFFKVGPEDLTMLPPSILIRAVKLQREYSHRGKNAAQAITCGVKSSEATRRLVRHLSMVLGLSESALRANPEARSTLHVGEIEDGSVVLGFKSPPAEGEVGPALLVSKMIWDLHGKG
jgi:rRNA maturation protein Rpf1